MAHETAFRWIPRDELFPPEEPATAHRETELPGILRHLLTQRGIHAHEIESFLHPKLADLADPFRIPGMRPAVTRLLQAIDQKQNVCIYGDYDVDGISSITLARKILRAYGLEPTTFIPHRGTEGYGLSPTAIERCIAENGKPDLVITVDCGTVSSAEIALLRQQNIDVVIVDHHEPNPDSRPECTALVNPKCGSDFTYLCAAGVVFKLGHALLKSRSNPLDLRTLLDLVAVATVADIVPLVGENRILVRHGLKRLPTSLNPGLIALQKIAGITSTPNSMDVGFRISPRINAAGRMDRPEDALALLNADCRRSAEELATILDDHNRRRQTHENLIRRQAMTHLSEDFDPSTDPVIVLGSREWHHGVVGIVASRLMRQYYKPTFVIAIDQNGLGKGSGRSIEGVSLVKAIRACQSELIGGGGHDMAAGLSIDEKSLGSFRKKFSEYVLSNTTTEDRRPRLHFDLEVTLSQLSLDFLASYELLHPFGNANPQPVFVAREVELSRPPQHLKNNHLRFMLRQDCHEQDAVFFSGAERDLPDPPWDILFQIERNTFRGKTSLQLIIQDIAPAGSR